MAAPTPAPPFVMQPEDDAGDGGSEGGALAPVGSLSANNVAAAEEAPPAPPRVAWLRQVAALVVVYAALVRRRIGICTMLLGAPTLMVLGSFGYVCRSGVCHASQCAMRRRSVPCGGREPKFAFLRGRPHHDASVARACGMPVCPARRRGAWRPQGRVCTAASDSHAVSSHVPAMTQGLVHRQPSQRHRDSPDP